MTKMDQIVVAGNWVRGRRTVDIDRPQTQAHGHYAGRNMGIRSNRLTFHETILFIKDSPEVLKGGVVFFFFSQVEHHAGIDAGSQTGGGEAGGSCSEAASEALSHPS